MRRFYNIILLITFYISTTSCLCYFPDGTLVERDTPCSTAANSTCCGQGFACLSNNLCAVTSHVDAGPGQSTYVRGSCTDKTWNSAECPTFCLNWDHGDNPAGGMGIAKCPYIEERFYCLDRFAEGFSAEQMCSNSSNYFAFADVATTATVVGVTSSSSAITTSTITTPAAPLSSSSSSSSSIGASATATSTSSSPPSQDNQNTSSSSNNNAIAIGAGVGAPLGVIAISVALFLFYRHRRHQRLGPKTANQPDEFVPPATTHDYKPRPGDVVYERWEAPSSGPQEMPAENIPHELR
ncbi:hypothetical protein PtrSN002B_007082 [Pyrenophora tritici-repentis]|uniref:SKG6 multi-domain protein n=2 Tax=Pyrenophora tritici-repentis TaxID=45151 RepID=A0A2W1EAL1_9PLEO|nr:uncharacterized protein PTRG_04294 [Pyrenophora tritici-repentis Pt-1C-BFP]KAA8619613.1 hypothetical protein PtrV1_06707 [Pyrenophora tritici-repentis]EDU47132.1 conserved hypothetical protein [Pyrenophora tritici-repentis Pt-1C-BFP]KAF7447756.1 hypothetical protein A1F99_071200 [Pyrenophora tritici-repentis]KAF7571451.1 SKG6 multi-domain protein [Pyrenophora tritici-repentis]KAG9385315.1 hypothetical protein A1F94_004862 [Pyrenophora tritici-repentis]